MNRNTLSILALSVLTSGCYQEGLLIEDLSGFVTVARAAATRTLTEEDEEGNVLSETEITDVKLIGPVYIGLYAGLDSTIKTYTHPKIGPIAQDAYPYGGTTIGDIRNVCLEFFSCKVTSNRFVDFDELVDWFTDVVDDAPTDAQGRVIETGEFIRQNCFDLLEVSSDEELRVTPPDSNEDGVIDILDLDFVENEDGDFVGEFDMPFAEFNPGMTAWAFMDAPSAVSHALGTCNPRLGFFEQTYNNDYQVGVQYNDILNIPGEYLLDGDWVSTEGFVWDDPQDVAQILVAERVGGEVEQSGEE
jgi:hypothetical protein